MDGKNHGSSFCINTLMLFSEERKPYGAGTVCKHHPKSKSHSADVTRLKRNKRFCNTQIQLIRDHSITTEAKRLHNFMA